MKTYRVTIKYKEGEKSGVISSTVPASTEKQAIEQIIVANNLDGKVVSKKAEPLKIN